MRASLDQAMGTAHGLSHNADLGCYMEYNEQVIITLANEVKRLQAEIKLQNKDWCDDDEAIKQQALRVLPKFEVEGDSVHVPRMGELAKMMADEALRQKEEGLAWMMAAQDKERDLAAAKAASVWPVGWTEIRTNPGGNVVIYTENHEIAFQLMAWLRDRMKDTTPPEA